MVFIQGLIKLCSKILCHTFEGSECCLQFMCIKVQYMFGFVQQFDHFAQIAFQNATLAHRCVMGHQGHSQTSLHWGSQSFFPGAGRTHFLKQKVQPFWGARCLFGRPRPPLLAMPLWAILDVLNPCLQQHTKTDGLVITIQTVSHSTSVPTVEVQSQYYPYCTLAVTCMDCMLEHPSCLSSIWQAQAADLFQLNAMNILYRTTRSVFMNINDVLV